MREFRNIQNRDDVVKCANFGWEQIHRNRLKYLAAIGERCHRIGTEFASATPELEFRGESAFEFVEELHLNVIEFDILSEVLVVIVLCGVPDVASERNQTCATASLIGLPDRTLEGVYCCVMTSMLWLRAYLIHPDLRLVADKQIIYWEIKLRRVGFASRFTCIASEVVFVLGIPEDKHTDTAPLPHSPTDNPHGNWVMPLDHPGMKPLAVVMDNFFKAKGAELAHETQAAGVGIPVNQVSMLLVPTVWRMVTAFRIAQLHPMMLPVEDIPIERWTGQQSNQNDWERWNALDPGDSQAIPESVLNYEDYRLAVGYQPQHVRVTPRARMLTRNTVMNPTMRSTALAAREIVNQNDLMLWRALIMETMKYNHVKVSTWQNQTSWHAADTAYTIRDGLIPYEWIVTEDGNENVAKSGLVRNFPANGSGVATSISQRLLQPFEVQTLVSANAALLYNTDYTVDWVAGTITLTAAGATKAGTAGIRLKYSYARNIAVWDATVPAGRTFDQHLRELRFKVSDARVLIKDRHYEPEALCWNFGLMDKISAGQNFTNEGTNITYDLDRMSNVLRYAGQESIDSTAIPEEYIICTQMMSILFGMHTPFTLTGEVITDNTGDRRYFGEQFAGSGVPAPEKASIVLVKNVP